MAKVDRHYFRAVKGILSFCYKNFILLVNCNKAQQHWVHSVEFNYLAGLNLKIMKKQLLLIFGLAVLLSRPGYSQTIINPNYGLKSHETLEIKKIECNSESTSVFLSIENRIQGGAFCADKNIYILYPDGTKSKLISSSGIPVCPESFKFKAIGEKLDFKLVFPPLKEGTEWIDLVEDCDDDCFSFYGVTLDQVFNQCLDELFAKASEGTPADNIILFKSILDSISGQNPGIEGSLYVNIIEAAREESDYVNARVWYKRLASSNAHRLHDYIKYLNDKGIKY